MSIELFHVTYSYYIDSSIDIWYDY